MGLGNLPQYVQNNIDDNRALLELVINKANNEKKYKFGQTLSFDEIDRLYNVGISEDEKRAWVWYKMSLGQPMKGSWKKYYPPQGGSSNEVLIARVDTEILDNAYRPISIVPKGSVLGKPTRFTNQYGDKTMLIFATPQGNKCWVNEADVIRKKTGSSTTEVYIDSLVKKMVLFYADGLFYPYAFYVFGNMYDRRLQLDADKATIIQRYGREVYAFQEKAIEQAMPRRLSVQNPDPRERPRILAISKFARNPESFFITNLSDESGIDLQGIVKDQIRSADYGKENKEKRATKSYWSDKVSEQDGYRFCLTDAFKKWILGISKFQFKEVTAYEIIRYYIEKNNMDSSLPNEKKDTINKYAPIEGEEFFSRFLNEALTFDDQQKLDFTWNQIYNGYAAVAHQKVPVGFECSALFKQSILQFTAAQRESIAFMEIAGSGILAYDVGVGKTMSAIITLANAMQQGKCSRPLIVVPNPTYKKWIRELVGYKEANGTEVAGVLTGLNIKINELYNLGASIKFDKNSNVQEGSITIMTYEGFAKLGFSNKISGDLFYDLIRTLSQQDSDTKPAREIEKAYQKYRELMGIGNKNTICDIDTLGFDYLIIDEAHNFKNVFDKVNVDENGDKRYDIKADQTNRGIKAFLHCNYIQRTFGQNVLLLTATPFTNSPLEIYSMLSLVAHKSMKEMGILNLQRFMQTFVLQSLEFVNDFDGNIALKPVVKQFQNRLVLQKLINNHILYKTGEEAGVKRPVKINLPRTKQMQNGKLVALPLDEQTLTYLKPNEAQKANQITINNVAQNSKELSAIGKAINASLDNALSPYVYEGDTRVSPVEYVQGSPKILYVVECISSVKKWHEERGQTCSGQVIYMNRGKDFFPHIKKYLEQVVGFKQNVRFNSGKLDEVEIISSGISQDDKEAIKEGFLAGVVKVIIGTATITEGIDLQTRGSVIYNCYPPWSPTTVRQLEGRIWRQGNMFGYIRIVMPLVQDSMDVFVFQKLEEKTARINDIWFRSDRGNVLDQESLDPEEIKFALFTNIGKLVELKYNQYSKELNRKKAVIKNNIDVIKSIKGLISSYNYQKKGCREFIELLLKETELSINQQKYESNGRANGYLNGKSEVEIKTIVEEVKNYIENSKVFSYEKSTDKETIAFIKYSIKIFKVHLGWSSIFSLLEMKLGEFLASVSQLRKAERTTLADKGYTLNDDMRKIIEAYENDDKIIDREREIINGDDWNQKTYNEIVAYKKKAAIFGQTPEDCAKSFAKLNNLLAYSSSEVTKESPTPRSRNLALPAAESGKEKEDNKALELRERESKSRKRRIKILMMEF